MTTTYNHEIVAKERAEALRASVKAALEAAGYRIHVGESWSRLLYVSPKGSDEGDTSWLVEADIRGGRRDYGHAVMATVRASSWSDRRHHKAATFWADYKKDFVVDPARIVAKVTTMMDGIAANKVRETEARTAERARMKREADAAKPVHEAIKTLKLRNEPRTYMEQLSDWSIRESGGYNDAPYAYSFSLKLHDLTREQVLAILPLLVGPK